MKMIDYKLNLEDVSKSQYEYIQATNREKEK